jgi:hypothetical protein
MTDDIESDVDVHKRELIESAATLYAVQKIYGDKVREQSKAAYRRLVDAHLLITGVLATGLLRTHGKIIPITDNSDERNALFASYVIGMEACKRTIEEGRYLQAHALLRQEMETLASSKRWLRARGTRTDLRMSPCWESRLLACTAGFQPPRMSRTIIWFELPPSGIFPARTCLGQPAEHGTSLPSSKNWRADPSLCI